MSNATPTPSRLFHTVYNVQATRYFEWQSRNFMFWAKVCHPFPLLHAHTRTQSSHRVPLFSKRTSPARSRACSPQTPRII